MAREQVSIIIRARDLATQVLRRTDRTLKNIGVSAKGLATAFGAVVASATGLAYVGKKIFDLGAAAVETRNKFDTVFGPEGRELVQGFLDDWARMAGLSKQNAQAITSTTGAILQGLGATREESARLSIQTVQLAGDLASFNNLRTDEVLEAINAGLTGEREQLKRLGIVLRQVDVDQRALTLSGKNSAKQLTDMDRTLASLQLISERAGVALGDLARTADSPANKAKQLRAAWQDVIDDFSQKLLPTLTELLPLIDDLAEAAANAAPKLARFFQGAADFLGLTSVNERQAEQDILAEIESAGDDLEKLIALRTDLEERISAATRHMTELTTQAHERTVRPGLAGGDMPSEAAMRARRMIDVTEDELAGLSDALDTLNTKITGLEAATASAARSVPPTPAQRVAAFGSAVTVGDVVRTGGDISAVSSFGTMNQQRAGELFRAFNPGDLAAQLTAAVAPYNEALQRRAELEREAAQVIEDTLTPQERYNWEVARLQTLRDAGVISEEVYARAVKETKEALDDAAAAGKKAAISTEQFAVAMLNMAASAVAASIEGGFSFGRALQFAGGITSLIPGGQLIGAGLTAAGTVANAVERKRDEPTDVIVKGYRQGALDQLRDVQGPIQVINQLVSPSSGEVVRAIEYELDRRTRLRKRSYVPGATDFGGGG